MSVYNEKIRYGSNFLSAYGLAIIIGGVVTPAIEVSFASTNEISIEIAFFWLIVGLFNMILGCWLLDDIVE